MTTGSNALDDHVGWLGPDRLERMLGARVAGLARVLPAVSAAGTAPAPLPDQRHRAHRAVRALLQQRDAVAARAGVSVKTVSRVVNDEPGVSSSLVERVRGAIEDLDFRPNAGATRGQLVKIASESAGFDDEIAPDYYTFTDVEPGHTFWIYIERLLLNRPDAIAGYPCGGPGEPCDSENRPYFRPNNGVTSGQASKILRNTFFPGCNPPGR